MKEIRDAIVAYMTTTLGITFTFSLQQNWPNPFNPSTTIRFTVPEETANARVVIYDVLGRRVWEQVFPDVQIGAHEFVWSGETASGSPAASGMYLYRFTAGKYVDSKRMLLLK